MSRIAAALSVSLLVLTTQSAFVSGIGQASVAARAGSLSIRWKGIDPEPLRHKGSVSFTFETSARGPSVRVGYNVTDSDGDPVASATGIRRRTGQASVSWDARDDGGSRVVPGLYRVRMDVTSRNGDSVKSSWKPFRVLTPGTAEVVRRVDGAGDRVALTFDDCYKQAAWSRILRTLRTARVHATFFCPGEQVKRYPQLARRTVAQGNAIGSHGWDHRKTTHLSYRGIRTRLINDQRAWWDVARNTPAPYFRPPYGAYDSKTLRAAGDTGYARVILWDVDAHDARRPGPSVIAHRVVSRARSGSIVEMNVLGQTAAALPSILRGLRKEHLRPVTLPVVFESA